MGVTKPSELAVRTEDTLIFNNLILISFHNFFMILSPFYALA